MGEVEEGEATVGHVWTEKELSEIAPVYLEGGVSGPSPLGQERM